MVNKIKELFRIQQIRFLFVGGLNTIIGYGSFALLLLTGMNYLIANTISYIIGVIHSYIWNKKFTFKSDNKSIMEIIKFIMVYLLNYFIGLGILYILVDKININQYLAGALNLIITTLISWFGHKYFSFSKINYMNKIKNFFNKYKKIILLVVLFISYFILLLAFKNSIKFTDEGDNMLGGMVIAKGGSIYGDFPSQHLPFMYYIMSIFSFIGFKGTVALRLCFYALLSLIWVLMYKRYSKKIGKLPLIIYPIFYIFMMANYKYGHNVLADHIEAQCLVILLLELYLFYKNKKLSKYSDLIIGLSIYAAVWSAFVSIIPIFIIIIGLFIIDINNYIKINGKFNLSKYINFFLKNYYRVLIFTILPFIISLFPIIISGNFKNFYTQAFYINTEIYSKYNFYTSNVILTSLKAVYNFINYHLILIKHLPNNFSLLANLVFLVLNILFVTISFKKNKLFTIIIMVLIILSGNRGFDNFHAIPYFALSIMSFLMISDKIEYKKVKYLIIIILLLILGFRYFPITEEALKPTKKDNYKIDRKLTNTNGYIYYYDLQTYKYVDSGLTPASKYTTLVPWFAELYEEDAIKDLKKNKPNIIYYEPGGEVWGYNYYKFAKKMDRYIKKNYLYVSGYDFWILNDYVEEAEKILKIKIADYSTDYNPDFTLNPIIGDTKIEQTFKAESNEIHSIDLRFKKRKNKENYSLIKFSLYDNKTLLKEIIVSAEKLKDSKYYKFKLNDIILEKGKNYKIEIRGLNTTNYDYVTIFCTKDKDNFDDNHAIINGIDKKYDLDMNIYYK